MGFISWKVPSQTKVGSYLGQVGSPFRYGMRHLLVRYLVLRFLEKRSLISSFVDFRYNLRELDSSATTSGFQEMNVSHA